MRISKKGITFNYNNDEITWLWWWARISYPFRSLIYDLGFYSFKEYWQHVGRTERPLSISKIRGYPMADMIDAWIKLHCRTGIYVVLYDINVEAKPATFWRSIPDKDKTQLLSDVVVLKCKDTDEMKSLCDSISKDFAQAYGTSDGCVVYWNYE